MADAPQLLAIYHQMVLIRRRKSRRTVYTGNKVGGLAIFPGEEAVAAVPLPRCTVRQRLPKFRPYRRVRLLHRQRRGARLVMAELLGKQTGIHAAAARCIRSIPRATLHRRATSSSQFALLDRVPEAADVVACLFGDDALSVGVYDRLGNRRFCGICQSSSSAKIPAWNGHRWRPMRSRRNTHKVAEPYQRSGVVVDGTGTRRSPQRWRAAARRARRRAFAD